MIVKRKDGTSLFRPWREVVVLEASQRESVRLGHLLGTKRFWVDKGERVRMSIPKSWCATEGDDLDLERLVFQDQLKFDWEWV